MQKENNLKILHIINHFLPCKGGMEEVAYNLCKEALSRRDKPEVLCLNKCPKSKEILPKSEIIQNIKIKRLPFLNLGLYKISLYNPFSLKKYDLAFLHGFSFLSDFALLTKPLHKTKLFFITHGGIFHTKKHSFLKKIYFNYLAPFLLSFSEGVIAVSNQDKETFRKIVPENKIKTIENGIDFSRFSIVSTEKKDKYSFVYLGRLSRNKQIDKLILLFEKLVNEDQRYTLHIIGPDFDNLKKELKDLIYEKNLQYNIFLHGPLAQKDINTIFSKSLYFISASAYEGFGLTAIEAMAARSILFLNKIPTFEKLISSTKAGVLLDFSDLDSCKKKILEYNRKLLPELKEIARKNYALAKKWAWENVYDSYEQYILSFLKNQPKTK